MIVTENLINNPILILSITDRCNLKCDYCFKQNERKPLGDLPLEDWKTAYNMYKPRIIQLFGGEPTLRWNDILKFFDYVYKENPLNPITYCDIDTNGTTGVDYEDIPKEYRNYISSWFSLDGFKKTNDKHRGKGSYEKTLNSIKKSINAGIATSVSCTLPSQDFIDNIDSISEFIEYFFNIGVLHMKLGTAFEPNTANTLATITDEATLKAVKMLKKLEVVKKYDVLVLDRNSDCNKFAITIQANGEFTPKCSSVGISYGNYKNWTLEKALKLNNYCSKIKWDCKSTSCKNLDRFANGLLLLK